MSNLKVGMRVVAVTDYPENSSRRIISIGDFGTIIDIAGDYVNVKFDNQCKAETFYSWRVEPAPEEPKQMKATDKITVEITLAELAKIYAVMGKANGETICKLYGIAQDKLDPTNKRGMFMQKIEGASALDYNRYEKEFMKLMFPEPPKKSKEQIKIEELQASIDKACKEIKELREMGEKK